MVLDQSANLEYIYHTCNAWHMRHDWKIEHWELEYVYTHIRVAHLLFHYFDFSHCDQVMEVAFPAEVALVVVEIHLCLCISSVAADSVLGHFDNEGSSLCDIHESLPGVFLSPSSHFYDQETQLLACSLLEQWYKIS